MLMRVLAPSRHSIWHSIYNADLRAEHATPDPLSCFLGTKHRLPLITALQGYPELAMTCAAARGRGSAGCTLKR